MSLLLCDSKLESSTSPKVMVRVTMFALLPKERRDERYRLSLRRYPITREKSASASGSKLGCLVDFNLPFALNLWIVHGKRSYDDEKG